VEEGSRKSVGDKLVEIVCKLGGTSNENPPKTSSSFRSIPAKRSKLQLKKPVQIQEPLRVQDPVSRNPLESPFNCSYTVTYGRQTIKIHKTFEDDGILVHDAVNKTLILKSSDLKVVDVEQNFNSELKIGMRVDVGNKLVEIIEKLTPPSNLKDQVKQNPSKIRSFPKNPFKPPTVFERSLEYRENIPFVEKEDQ
jgi:hypothetical protein